MTGRASNLFKQRHTSKSTATVAADHHQRFEHAEQLDGPGVEWPTPYHCRGHDPLSVVVDADSAWREVDEQRYRLWIRRTAFDSRY